MSFNPSTPKTPNCQLPQWVSGDKPAMEDFNQVIQNIDTELGSLNDSLAQQQDDLSALKNGLANKVNAGPLSRKLLWSGSAGVGDTIIFNESIDGYTLFAYELDVFYGPITVIPNNSRYFGGGTGHSDSSTTVTVSIRTNKTSSTSLSVTGMTSYSMGSAGFIEYLRTSTYKIINIYGYLSA